jgi:hypothetical protein
MASKKSVAAVLTAAAAAITESEERAALIADLGGEDEETTTERAALLAEFEEGVSEGMQQVAAMSSEERAAQLAELAGQEDTDIGFTDDEANGQPEPRRCLCGCNAIVSKKARFKVGHDAALKGELVKLSRAGNVGAKATLAELGWSHFDVPTKSMIRKQEREAAKAQLVTA